MERGEDREAGGRGGGRTETGVEKRLTGRQRDTLTQEKRTRREERETESERERKQRKEGGGSRGQRDPRGGEQRQMEGGT